MIVIVNRPFCFRRLNRQDDFRASGSGVIQYEQEVIDYQLIPLVFSAAQKIGAQGIAIDGMYGKDKPVAGEMIYRYTTWAVHNCPGYWIYQEKLLTAN